MVKSKNILTQYYLRALYIAFWTEYQGFHEEKFVIYVKKGTLKIKFVNFTGFSTKSVPD